MQTETIINVLIGLQTTANGVNLLNAPITGSKLVQELQGAADKFKAAVGDKTTGGDPVDAVYDNPAGILIGKSSLTSLVPSLEPIKNAHSNMAAALDALVP